jgi:hypothetical protein
LLNCSLVPIFDFGNSPTARSTAGLGEFPVRHNLDAINRHEAGQLVQSIARRALVIEVSHHLG